MRPPGLSPLPWHRLLVPLEPTTPPRLTPTRARAHLPALGSLSCSARRVRPRRTSTWTPRPTSWGGAWHTTPRYLQAVTRGDTGRATAATAATTPASPRSNRYDALADDVASTNTAQLGTTANVPRTNDDVTGSGNGGHLPNPPSVAHSAERQQQRDDLPDDLDVCPDDGSFTDHEGLLDHVDNVLQLEAVPWHLLRYEYCDNNVRTFAKMMTRPKVLNAALAALQADRNLEFTAEGVSSLHSLGRYLGGTNASTATLFARLTALSPEIWTAWQRQAIRDEPGPAPPASAPPQTPARAPPPIPTGSRWGAASRHTPVAHVPPPLAPDTRGTPVRQDPATTDPDGRPIMADKTKIVVRKVPTDQSVTWDGNDQTFESFKTRFRLHMATRHIGYLLDPAFVKAWTQSADKYSPSIAATLRADYRYTNQILANSAVLYAILGQAINDVSIGHLIAATIDDEASHDGIGIWAELLQRYWGRDDVRYRQHDALRVLAKPMVRGERMDVFLNRYERAVSSILRPLQLTYRSVPALDDMFKAWVLTQIQDPSYFETVQRVRAAGHNWPAARVMSELRQTARDREIRGQHDGRRQARVSIQEPYPARTDDVSVSANIVRRIDRDQWRSLPQDVQRVISDLRRENAVVLEDNRALRSLLAANNVDAPPLPQASERVARRSQRQYGGHSESGQSGIPVADTPLLPRAPIPPSTPSRSANSVSFFSPHEEADDCPDSDSDDSGPVDNVIAETSA